MEVFANAHQSGIVQSLFVHECHHVGNEHNGQDPAEVELASIYIKGS